LVKVGEFTLYSSQVLASAEHYLSATGALLQDLEGEGIAEIKSLLLQLDKALGASQVLDLVILIIVNSWE
jgi:hypothetical protein